MLTVNAASGFGSGGPAAYVINNSCTFNGSNEGMDRTWSASPTDSTTFTMSAWVNRDGIGVKEGYFGTQIQSSKNSYFYFLSSPANVMEIYQDNASQGQGRRTTATVLADTWTHIGVTWDTELPFATRIHFNGVELTDYTAIYTTAGASMAFNHASIIHEVGHSTHSTDTFFNGLLAEVIFIDGLIVPMSSFYNGGKAVDPSGLTFGDDGFHLNFEDSSDMGKDVSGNGNDFTLSNIDSSNQSTDVPAQ